MALRAIAAERYDPPAPAGRAPLHVVHGGGACTAVAQDGAWLFTRRESFCKACTSWRRGGCVAAAVLSLAGCLKSLLHSGQWTACCRPRSSAVLL
jgi:hypothetical protein